MTSLTSPSSSGVKPWRRGLLPMVAIGAAVIAVTLLLLLLRAPQSVAVEEVSRDQLVLRDGRLYRLDYPVPFAGVMREVHADGTLKSRSHLAHGRLEGLSEGWHTNGVKQVEEHFRAGVSHGPRTKWHDNGRKLSEVEIVNGQLEGTFRRWHEEGSLAEEIALKHGQPDGLSRAFYPSGCLKAEARLAAGRVLEQQHWHDGEQPGVGLSPTTTAAMAAH